MSDQQHILLVEDEDSLAQGLMFNLKEEGYSVTRAADGREAIRLFQDNQYDLIILDIMLPYYDGFEIAAIVRKRQPQIPILMLTARTSLDDRIQGLESGADDYLTKPFHLKELLLRVKGMLKRKQWYQDMSASQPLVRFGENKVDFNNLTAVTGDTSVQLTQHEAMVLRYLVEHEGKVVSRRELLENVWHTNPEIETRTVDIFIMRLRKYFEPNPSRPVFFKSIRSAGYMFQKQ
ncbi:MAG: response regulator transcription factor [candidate division KSB1 bacterium]|nr:response regulator transcription factor [candidate division KSB1 bacterium]